MILYVYLRVAEGYLRIMESEQFRESVWNTVPCFGTSKAPNRTGDFVLAQGLLNKLGFFNLFLDMDS